MKDLALDDIQRLAMEVGFTTSNPEEWAEKTDFPFEVLAGIGESTHAVIMNKMVEAASQAFGNNIEEWPDPSEAPIELVDINFASLIRDACISSFVLGFETARQFGPWDGKLNE